MNNSGRFIFKNDTQKILDHLYHDKYRNLKELSELRGKSGELKARNEKIEKALNDEIGTARNRTFSMNNEMKSFCFNNDIISNKDKEDFKYLCERDTKARYDLEASQLKMKKEQEEFEKENDRLNKEMQNIENRLTVINVEIQKEIKQVAAKIIERIIDDKKCNQPNTS